MINITPLRRTIRHLVQRLRMEGETFIIQISLLAACLMTAKGLIILVIFLSVYILVRFLARSFTRQSGEEVLLR